jgi:hypothetical protein
MRKVCNGKLTGLPVWEKVVCGLCIVCTAVSAVPLLAGWEVQGEMVGEGIPSWMAVVKSRDCKLLFWVEYPTDGPCVPQVVLKSDGWEAFSFDPVTVNRIATVIRFTRERLLQVAGYAGNGFIFEWELEKGHFAEMLAGFAEEKEFLVSLPGRQGEVRGTFDLDGAVKAIGEACAACEESFFAQNDFVFPDSAERLLKRAEIIRLPPGMLRIARNEIYARNGHVFKDQALDKFFKTRKWYQPADQESTLSETEKANVGLMASCE